MLVQGIRKKWKMCVILLNIRNEFGVLLSALISLLLRIQSNK